MYELLLIMYVYSLIITLYVTVIIIIVLLTYWSFLSHRAKLLIRHYVNLAINHDKNQTELLFLKKNKVDIMMSEK